MRLLRVREEDVDVRVDGVGRRAHDDDDSTASAQQAAQQVATSERLAQGQGGDEGVGEHRDGALVRAMVMVMVIVRVRVWFGFGFGLADQRRDD